LATALSLCSWLWPCPTSPNLPFTGRGRLARHPDINWSKNTTKNQAEPLKCDCGGCFRVIAFITEHKVITKILKHLEKTKTKEKSRAPPES
jgi:hypothetical protein